MCFPAGTSAPRCVYRMNEAAFSWQCTGFTIFNQHCAIFQAWTGPGIWLYGDYRTQNYRGEPLHLGGQALLVDQTGSNEAFIEEDIFRMASGQCEFGEDDHIRVESSGFNSHFQDLACIPGQIGNGGIDLANGDLHAESNSSTTAAKRLRASINGSRRRLTISPSMKVRYPSESRKATSPISALAGTGGIRANRKSGWPLQLWGLRR